MICARCGTEHNDPDKICPRCFYGRPRQKVKLPKWVVWLISVGSSLAVIGVAAFVIITNVQKNRKNDWLKGIWESADLALIISEEGNNFQLINGSNVLVGKYLIEEDLLRLIAEDGMHYIYTYELKDENTLEVSYADGEFTVRETLDKIHYSVE